MKIKLFSMFVAAGMLLAGCAEIETPKEGGSVIAIMEGDQTRTSVTDGGAFSWSAGDQVWLQTTNGSVVGTLSSGAGTSRASFSTGVFIGELTGKAVYPYNASHSISGDELSFVLPASYDLGSNLANTNAAMYGVDVDGTIRFNHLAGVMRFVFKNAPVGTDKFQITLDKKINGIFTADLLEALPVIETSAASPESEKTVTLNFDALESVSDISLYVPLPVGTYTTLGLELWAGDKSLWSYSNTVTNKIGRKTLKLMPAVNMGTSVEGDIEGGVADLSVNGTANSYIVSEAGKYKFSTVKGNSSESVGAVASAEVLWETFGTDVTPNVGDLVKNAVYSDGCITFQTAETFKEGSAVIAAKDASGTILWSWHIWLTDQPEEQVYYNNAGTMMDRNLGATSATPGDVGALGLLYQWGRKDPFLGSSSISERVDAKSTITRPSYVSSDSSNGTIAYATANPTTFIAYNSNNDDWYYTGSESTDNTRWTTSDKTKSIYDPCPSGWRVPDGGSNGVWSKALGSSSSYYDTYNYANEGINFSGKFGSASTIWYPASGYRNFNHGSLHNVGNFGVYWSASPYSNLACSLGFDSYVYPSANFDRASGLAVRCVKEGTGGGSSDSDSNVHKETVRFKSVTYDWTLQRALDLRGDNNEPYAKPIINNVRYDNIYALEQVLRPDSEYQITKTVKCGDQIVDPSVITIQNISPPTAAREGSADIVLSGYEFGDTENTYSFEILASNDDLELIITGFITLGALPETVEIEREVALMLVPGTTQFEGVEALVADAYEELGVENAGFNEANLAKVNDVMLAVLMDPENVVTNVPDYLTNLNFRVDANVDNSFVRLYNEQIANNILNPDGYVFERTIDTWFGVDFVYTITAKPGLPKNYLIPSEVRMTTDENDVKYVKVLGEINSEGVYTIDLVDLGKYFNVASEIENNLKVKFDILRGDVLLSANEVEVNALGELENIKAVLDWDQYAGTVVDVKASLLAENTYILDELDFQLRTKDPLTFEFGDIVRVTRVPGMSASAKVYENVVLTSSVEPSWTNLINQNAATLQEIFANSHADKTYGIEPEVSIWGVYTDEAMTVPYPTQKWAADNLNGTITLFSDDGQLLYPIYAKATLSFTHNIHGACTAKKDIIIIFV